MGIEGENVETKAEKGEGNAAERGKLIKTCMRCLKECEVGIICYATTDGEQRMARYSGPPPRSLKLNQPIRECPILVMLQAGNNVDAKTEAIKLEARLVESGN